MILIVMNLNLERLFVVSELILACNTRTRKNYELIASIPF